MKSVITKNEQETFEFAKKYTKKLKGADIVGLIGNLGAGKTIFSKGIASGLGINENITSPTFVYMKVYDVQDHPSIKKFCHIDAYRIEDEQILANIGVLEYFNNPEVLTVIEWADKIDSILDFNTLLLEFKINKEIREIFLKNKKPSVDG